MKNLFQAVDTVPLKRFLIVAAVVALLLLAVIAWDVHAIRNEVVPTVRFK